MSEIKAQIQERIKIAMKARDQHRLTTLRGVMAAIKQIEVDTRKELVDGDILSIVQKEIKKRRETLKFAEEQQRTEIVAENNAEIEYLLEFAGQQLSEAEVRTEIEKVIAGGASSLGEVMGALNKNHKGKFDGRAASELAKTLLPAGS